MPLGRGGEGFRFVRQLPLAKADEAGTPFRLKGIRGEGQYDLEDDWNDCPWALWGQNMVWCSSGM
jgi:hypothetical protein